MNPRCCSHNLVNIHGMNNTSRLSIFIDNYLLYNNIYITSLFYVKPLRAVGARTVHVLFSRAVSSDTAPRVAAHCACREL